jgi:hypothetical protein
LNDKLLFTIKENNRLNARTKELEILAKKEIKPSYYEIFKKFIINLVTNLVTFGLLKAILKRTVNPYLEKLISYVIMGVLFNNIFGGYFIFIHEILLNIINTEAITSLFSIFGLTTFTGWFKYLYEFIKRIYSHFIYDSIHTPLGVINDENEIKMDKQLELDRIERERQLELQRLQKTNEELFIENDKLIKEQQENLNKDKISEQTKTWSSFFEKIGKDFGKTAYDSLKILIISSLLKSIAEKCFTDGQFEHIKTLLSKYFTKKDDSDDGSSDSFSYRSESDIQLPEEGFEKELFRKTTLDSNKYINNP